MKVKSSQKPKSERYCIDCGAKGVEERRRCKECAKEHNRKRSRERYKLKGRQYYGMSTCPICNKPMTLWKKDQGSHISCRPKTTDDYNKIKRSTKGNTLARQKILDMGITIPKDYVVHHLDENPDNNELQNLMIISRKSHNSLHRHLQHQRSLFLRENSSSPGNCWDNLRVRLTTAWLETTNANVIKISEIGQSAAEPLNSIQEYEEGSETRSGQP